MKIWKQDLMAIFRIQCNIRVNDPIFTSLEAIPILTCTRYTDLKYLILAKFSDVIFILVNYFLFDSCLGPMWSMDGCSGLVIIMTGSCSQCSWNTCSVKYLQKEASGKEFQTWTGCSLTTTITKMAIIGFIPTRRMRASLYTEIYKYTSFCRWDMGPGTMLLLYP